MNKINDLYQESKNSIEKNQSKLFARALEENVLIESEHESYKVDLAVPIFEYIYDNDLTCWGPCQVLGSWAPDNTWIWGWENKSVPAAGFEQIKSQILALSEISELVKDRKISMSQIEAYELAKWLAFKLNWLGCYPSATAQGGIAYLALKLTTMPNHSIEPKDNLWCILCGMFPEQVEGMARIAEGQGLCSCCIEKAMDVVAVSSSENERNQDRIDIKFSCCLCQEAQKGIAFPYVYLCNECIKLADGVFKKNK